MTAKKMYIAGQCVDAKNTFSVINPANNQPVANIAWADKEDALHALTAANEAFPTWSNTPFAVRAQWMLRLRDAIAAKEDVLREAIHLEMGKSWSNTKDDFQMLIDSLNFYAQGADYFQSEILDDDTGSHSHTLTHQSVGVAVAYLAWNFPLLNLAYKIGPAMAAGCPLIVKPSFKTPLSAYIIGEICADINLPAGVVNILCGDDSEIGDTLSSSTIPALLTLIGSTRTGLHIMKTGATSIKRYSMELGGNAPVIVMPDADLDLAVDIVCGVKFANAGQICVTPNRVFVHSDVSQLFAQKVVTRANNVKVGFDRHANIDMGPVIDQGSWQRIDALVQEAVTDGATLLAGGGHPAHLLDSNFYAPTVLKGIDASMRIYNEEIFGPVVSLVEFDDQSDIVAKANDTEAGLTAYIFTQDEQKATQLSSELDFGEIQINGIKYAINLPHGGMKQSGIGCDCSYLALQEYLVAKRVSRAI